MGPKPREHPGMACSTCYYLVISSTHLSNGHIRRVKGVFRGPLCASSDSPECTERALGCSAEDLKSLFYCELCDKQYLRHQEFDNHINSYDHAHKQRLKELQHREFVRNVASKSWKDQRKEEKALRRLHQLAQLQQETQRIPKKACELRQQEDQGPEEKPENFRFTQQTFASQHRTQSIQSEVSCRPLFQKPIAAAESPLITSTADTSPPAVQSQSSHSLCPKLPLPTQGKVGGRLGVSFCFSRRGPRLEPSASVFSDLEEEEREKREQIKERIKEIMEDIDREIGEADERKRSVSAKKDQSRSNCVSLRDIQPVPEGGMRDLMEKTDKEEDSFPFSRTAFDNQIRDTKLQTEVTVWDTPLGRMDINHKEIEAGRKQGAQTKREESSFVSVLGKDDSTHLRWPVSLLKFTKSQPHVSYSCNPLCMNLHPPEKLTEELQESQQNQLGAFSDESNPCLPAAPAPHAHSHLQTKARHEQGAHEQENNKIYNQEENIDEQPEAHLILKNKCLACLVTRPQCGDERECRTSEGNCERAAFHPFDPTQTDSSGTNSTNPLGGRLKDEKRIRRRAITALSCKLESVTQLATQGTCISPSRCDYRSETMSKCANTPMPCVCVPKVSPRRRKKHTKKHKLRKTKQTEGRKASKKQQSVKCKVRSVVSAVSAGLQSREETGGSSGKRRRQREKRMRRVAVAWSHCLPGRCEAEPVSVSVRKRRPHRNHNTEFKSQQGRAQAERSGIHSQLSRHAANRGNKGVGNTEGDGGTFPWRSHFSSHSFSPGCNSKPFWERGHHSNPRSFIDCCYPDNSCGSSPPKRRKVLHGDRTFIHNKRNCEVWEDRGREIAGHSGYRDRDLISDTGQWEWMRGSCEDDDEEGKSRTAWSLKNSSIEWDNVETFTPSPDSWRRTCRNYSTEDLDWDRRSMDRWTWGSSDNWEDRGTYRSLSGSRRSTESRESPCSMWRCTVTRKSSLKPFSSHESWRKRRRHQSVIRTQISQSPRSCSPCSSTNTSELSSEWSRSSTFSVDSMNGVRISSCRMSSHSAEKKHSSPLSSSYALPCISSQSPIRASSPKNSNLTMKHCESSSPKLKERNSQPDCSPQLSTHVTPGSSDKTLTALCPTKTLAQKPARILVFPLIGKLPAIQRKARGIKGLLEKSHDRQKGESQQEDLGTTFDRSTHALDDPDPSTLPNPVKQIRTCDKRTGGETAQPISFSAAEMDKYRLLQEQAREHMQKVLETEHESGDAHLQMDSTPNFEPLGDHYYSAGLQVPAKPDQLLHKESMERHVHHALHNSLPAPHLSPQENITQSMALEVPNLPPLPPISNLHHVIFQHAALSMPLHSSSASSSSLSPAFHPHLPPHPPSVPNPFALPPLSISSLFPSLLLSHHPFSFPHQSPVFHTSALTPLFPVGLQPLNPQPFMDRSWPGRFQQKAI